jgi:L-histidine N-alpha-methyltransferase
MNAIANVAIHSSQFPENVRRDLLQSLRTRKIAHKFHYDNVKQTQKWLALHQQFSPSRNDADCQAVYEQSFKAAVKQIRSKRVHLIGLGCGGGQKDTRLLRLLKQAGKEVFYTPCDVAAAMTLVARKTAMEVVPEKNCFPLVCDLETADKLPAVFKQPVASKAARIITFFGMIPNSEPRIILPKLASLISRKDILLLSANLAPGKNYAAGVKKILPQYDNAATHDWLLTFLLDLGIERKDGVLNFEIENKGALKRVVANFHFKQARQIEIEDKPFSFKRGDKIRLFFSYRYTPDRVLKKLSAYRLKTHDQWITKSGEEGVFLCIKG